MKVINTNLEGDFTLDDNAELYGTITGDVLVPPDYTLDIHGIVSGMLTVEQGATVRVMGTMNGPVINRGKLEIYGIARGGIDTQGGETLIGELAYIMD